MHPIHLIGISVIVLFGEIISSQNNVSLNATLAPSNFSSQGFPTKYPTDHVMHWTITAKNNTQVFVTILAGNIESCCDYLLMKYGDEGLGRFTGLVGGQARISPGNSMTLTFSSDQSIALQGFFASYQSATCGQNLFANESRQLFSTPNWPNDYPLNQDCFWIITSGTNEIIEIRVNEGATEADDDFIEIYDGLSKMTRLSGTIKPQKFLSQSGTFKVYFHSNNMNNEKGVSVEYQFATCRENLTALSTEQTFSTFFFPRRYAPLTSCEWYITATPNRKIFLMFLEGSTEDCCDLVKVYEGKAEVLQVSGKITSSNYLLSNGSQLRVTFESDSGVQEIGFRAMYEEVSCDFIFSVNKIPEAVDVTMRGPKCLMILRQTSNQQIQFNLESITLTADEYLEIFDGATSYGRLSGSSVSDVFTSTNGILRVYYHGGKNVRLRGTRQLHSCGSTVQVTDSFQHFVQFRSSSNFTNKSECTWNLFAPKFKQVQLRIIEVETKSPGNVQIYDGNTLCDPLVGVHKNMTYTSTTGRLRVTYGSGSFLQQLVAEAKEAPCGSTLRPGETSSVLTSPGWPLGYANDVICEWVIAGKVGYEVVVELNEMNLENCCDFVQIYEDNILKKQNSAVARFVSNVGGSLRVQFTSDGAVTGKGFNASYFIQAIKCMESRDAPENGTKVPNATGYYQFGDVVNFTCNTGHKLVGEKSISCGMNGTWSHPAPNCTKIQCTENRSAPVNGTITDNAKGYFEFEDVISFTCNPGYVLNGENIISCKSDGTWSHSAPVCTKNSSEIQTTTIGMNVTTFPTTSDSELSTDYVILIAVLMCLIVAAVIAIICLIRWEIYNTYRRLVKNGQFL